MMTVALKVDAPVKLLAQNGPDASFPFAVLGLGDVAIPAFFAALMHKFSLALDAGDAGPAAALADTAGDGVGGAPYGRNAVAAYALGIGCAFYANEYIRKGQPALLYLVPAVLGSAVLTAWQRGELDALFSYEAKVGDGQIPLDLALLSEEKHLRYK